jgi:hypothetical protein
MNLTEAEERARRISHGAIYVGEPEELGGDFLALADLARRLAEALAEEHTDSMESCPSCALVAEACEAGLLKGE